MLGSFYILLLIQLSVLSTNVNHSEDQILKGFIDAFNEKIEEQIWPENNFNEILPYRQFKNIIVKIRDVLCIINAKKYADFKSLIMETNMNLQELGYPYIETFNIISSVKRILLINDKHNKDLIKLEIKHFYRDVLSKELILIKNDLDMTLKSIDVKFDFAESLDILQENNDSYIKEDFNSLSKTDNLSSKINFIKPFIEISESILPLRKSEPVYVETHIGGFQFSKKCFDDKIKIFIREEYKTVCPFQLLQYSMSCLMDHSTHNQVDIKKYIDKVFICNKTASKVLISLFHYYSEIKKITTSYQVILIENDRYRLEWSFFKSPKLDEIKAYWMEKELKNVSSIKLFNNIGPVGKDNVSFSTIRSKNTENKPITTRLIVLSCGHQLGFELIDYFLEKHYMKYFRPLTCVKCKCQISVIGSYSASVYKLKSNNHCIIS